MNITLGYSPCPNDTFIFHALACKGIAPADLRFDIALHDVETLNQMAFDQVLDVTKISFYAWLKVRQHYRLLDSGGALGFGCGPVVVARKPMTQKDMANCKVALPGRWTTAHLLFRLWAPEADQRRFTTYDRIFDAVMSGEADCGVIIHESRFTFEQAGLVAVADLGAWWEDQTGLPIPLGGIAAHRRLGDERIDQVTALIRQSIETVRQNPAEALPYIRQYAREMDPSVLDAHIDTFVNEFSIDLGEAGHQAIDALAERARQAGIIP